MREMKKEGMVKSNPDFTVCVDSPLANEATKIFSGDLHGYLDEEALEVVKEGDKLFTFPRPDDDREQRGVQAAEPGQVPPR